jgi:hypothetical protein
MPAKAGIHAFSSSTAVIASAAWQSIFLAAAGKKDHYDINEICS